MTYRIAYQLYSSRNFPPLEAQFPELKAMGYDAIEPWLPAYEADPKAFRRALDDAGLACFGFHMPLKGLVEEPQRFIDIALELGATLMIPPFVPAEEREDTPAYWQRLGEKLARGADAAEPHGLKVAWHNHDFEYRPLPDGSRPIDHIFAGGDGVWFEIDCGWITRAGADPAAELELYADRIVAIQTKDTAPPGTAEGRLDRHRRRHHRLAGAGAAVPQAPRRPHRHRARQPRRLAPLRRALDPVYQAARTLDQAGLFGLWSRLRCLEHHARSARC